MLFSVGFDLDEPVREAIVADAEAAWVEAIRADGSERKHSQVCEITDSVDLSAWPEGSRLIARRTKLKEGDQQSFADHDGYRLAVFLTDQPDDDIPQLDLDSPRPCARRGPHPPGQGLRAANLPFQSFAHNQVWLWLVMAAQDLIAWTAQLCLADAARCWELKRLRYRLLHQSGRIARHARRRSCASRATGPGQASSLTRSRAYKRCRPTRLTRGARRALPTTTAPHPQRQPARKQHPHRGVAAQRSNMTRHTPR